MSPEIETMRRIPHMGTFAEARRWVAEIQNAWGDKPFEMTFDPCGIYVVWHRGELLGKGLTYEAAITDAERNWRWVSGELTLDGMACS